MFSLLDSYTVTKSAVGKMQALREPPSTQDSCKPTAENAAKAKALINFLMQDTFCKFWPLIWEQTWFQRLHWERNNLKPARCSNRRGRRRNHCSMPH